MSAHQIGMLRLPQVETLLQDPLFALYIKQLSRPLVTDIIRDALSAVRNSESMYRGQFLSDKHAEEVYTNLYLDIQYRCKLLVQQKHHKVINATGTIIHTNLGRSPIDPSLWKAVSDVNTGQCNLEIQLLDGKRGQRKGLVDCLLNRLTGSDDALVVNNNASSLYLMLNGLAKEKEVIVSRGEQIQIGGGIRIPDILAMSGAKLVDVGTTNITTADDYINAITENTAMVLMVHCSNFAIRGFTQSADVRQVRQALPKHVLLAVDQGSGLTTESFAPEENSVCSYIKIGADLVCFSGDKILGGPQAGIICGKKELIQTLEKNPLMRAFRPSRIIYSLLEELLIRKLNKKKEGQGIAERFVTNRDDFRLRTELLATSLGKHVRIVESEMVVGGGTLPDEHYPSWSLEVRSNKSAEKIHADLREMFIPVIAVIRNNRVQLNMAAVLQHDIISLECQMKKYFFEESRNE